MTTINTNPTTTTVVVAMTRQARVARLNRLAEIADQAAWAAWHAYLHDWTAASNRFAQFEAAARARRDAYAALAASISADIEAEDRVSRLDDLFAAIVDGEDNRWAVLLGTSWQDFSTLRGWLRGVPDTVRAVYDDAAEYYGREIPYGEFDADYGVNNLPYLRRAMEDAEEAGWYRLYVPFSGRPADMPVIWHCFPTYPDQRDTWEDCPDDFDWAELLPKRGAMHRRAS